MKKLSMITVSILLCAALAGCKVTDNKQAANTPTSSATPGEASPSASDPGAPETAAPTESIPPKIELMDENLILPDADFEGLSAPDNYSPSDNDRTVMEKMVSLLRVTNDALKELEQIKQEDPGLLDSKAPITELMNTIKDAHDEGRMLEYPDELKDFHALYQSVLVINYNGADMMVQAMDADDTTLADEAFDLFERGQMQYDKLIDYANLMLEK